ncbi:expressed unknown protein [Seminavis robusta]|uniref:PUB domain-containing protein n=1 Tax=Seminavis robusta TaxID=568900 RepID=A0A9N8E654_9STRA|nr:expressed unknown protein [Seminavis robusta]|eukprot:Sro693_g188320.1 n/a (274) ;mRNA; f:30291-31112
MVLNEEVAPDLQSATDADGSTTPNDNESIGSTSNGVVEEAVAHVLYHNVKTKQIVTTFKILHTLISNASSPQQEDPKKKRVRLVNPKIKQNIIEVEGAVELLELAGFVKRIEEHQEWLVYETSTDNKLAQLILTALDKSTKELESGARSKKPVSKVVQRKKEKEVDRYLALQRWKDDTQGRKATVTRKFKHELTQDAKRAQEQQKGMQTVDNLRPYLAYVEYAMIAGCAIFFCHDPSKAWQLGLFLFVFYWISILFVGLVDGRGGRVTTIGTR